VGTAHLRLLVGFIFNKIAAIETITTDDKLFSPSLYKAKKSVSSLNKAD